MPIRLHGQIGLPSGLRTRSPRFLRAVRIPIPTPGVLVDLEGFEPSSHGLKVRSVTVTLQIHLVGRSGVDPDSSGLQPDAFTGLAFFPFRGDLSEVPFPQAAS